MEFDDVVDERHSSRRFKTTQKPDYKDVIEAIHSAMYIPLAGNLPALKYILVSDKDKITELALAADQEFVNDVHFVIVVCSDKKFLVRNYQKRGERYSRQQAGAAVEQILLKLTDIGLNSCWVGAFSDVTIRNLLKIPTEIDVEALIPVGFEMGLQEGEGRNKPQLDRCLFFDTYKNRFMKPKREPRS